MNVGKLLRRKGTVTLGVPLVAVAIAVLLLASGGARPETSLAGGGPGMAFTGPGNMLVNQTITLTVVASPPPAVGVSGYATEVILPAGLSYQQRATCPQELVATHSGGQPAVLCTRAVGSAGQVRHVYGTGVMPPLPPLDTPITSLLQIDVQCTAPGSYKVALTALSAGASFGASYYGLDFLAINVATIAQDVDANGDTVVDYTQAAATKSITCTVPPPTPTPSPTRTRTPTPTPSPTQTPCGYPGPTCTPSPTPTEPPTATPSPTPTPLPEDSTLELESSAETSVPGGEVDITATVADGNGDPISDVMCTFSIIEAPEGSDAALDPETAVTDENGQATVGLSVGEVEGTLRVQADCANLSQVIDVDVLASVLPPEVGDADKGGVSTVVLSVVGALMAAAVAGLAAFGWRRYAARTRA